ncbi:hypothetical protein PHYSODRAFT_304692 [Phytophthora sojae]|uniref:Uncharacterized protein n=1 Tax=Phytophthora sojae (strain P6497) TaxID=1094619 RepID=G5A264_PHYSP|nr:hypothetical protein PHYSODRAFT_264745 [Phytophthora sojae]XP_009533757.1 hypothetical protein PHYSODRAFT_304692 [Phytophthora sojae]EGZ11004.1 hypothetical protein PHYSODRAFT_264745 [Phytophthora sojae]EGZ11012.1 hypothetical protein PHYSODRAFT_304692 [Phytophthora sojae]|eukprot:XP_009533749.1 hypothetical protein PHYSODRAFT_264745 [Phytophthora sojae]
MPLPDVELFTNLARLPTQPCAGNHPSSPRAVKACFGPAWCFMQGDNNNPASAWAFITADEARLLTLARRNLWTQDCLDELVARDLEEHMERVELTDDESKDEEAKAE